MVDSSDGQAAPLPSRASVASKERVPEFLNQRRDEIARQFKLDSQSGRTFAHLLTGEAGPPLLPGDSWNQVVNVLRSWWLVRLLREASREGDIAAFEWLLHLFLTRLCIAPPPRKGGRPQAPIYALMHKRWSENGKPPLTGPVCDELAADLDPEAFIEAKKTEQWRRLRGRISAAIKRIEKNRNETVSSRD